MDFKTRLWATKQSLLEGETIRLVFVTNFLEKLMKERVRLWATAG